MRFFPIKNLNARISSGYGKRKNPFTGEIQDHKGIDIAIPTGTEVFSPLDGLVIKTGETALLGKYIQVLSGDYKFIFGHLSKILIKTGDMVTKNKPIALSGSSGKVTGSHLHFAVFYKNQPINPLTGTAETIQSGIFILIPLIILYTILKLK